MDRGGRIRPQFVNGKTFENVEDLDDVDAAGRGWRHRDDLAASVGATHDLPLDRLVGGEILNGHAATSRGYGCCDPARRLALIESARSLRCDEIEARGEIALHEAFAAAQRRAVRMHEDRTARRP